MEMQETKGESGTNCLDCERYRTLGEVCVIEHGKKFLWEFCRDFSPQVELPDYNELMKSVKKEMVVEREKARLKKRRAKALLRKEIEAARTPKGRKLFPEKRVSNGRAGIAIRSSRNRRAENSKSLAGLK